MGVTLLDSVAVAGYLDPGDAFHAAASRELRAAAELDSLIASAVTYAELLTGARLGHHGDSEVRGFFSDLVQEIVPADASVAERAAELRGSARSLRMPDALILATADVYPADAILGGDERWLGVSGVGAQIKLLEPDTKS